MQDISKNVIRHRTAEVWQNSGCSSRCALHRALCPGYPRIGRIEAAGVEMAALARLDFDLRKALALKMTFKRGNNFIYLRADDVTKLAIGTRHARNGVDRPLRCACVKGQDLKTVPAEHPLGRRQIRFAPVAVNARTLGAAVDLDAGQGLPHRRR